jgi:hypothetical protein
MTPGAASASVTLTATDGKTSVSTLPSPTIRRGLHGFIEGSAQTGNGGDGTGGQIGLFHFLAVNCPLFASSLYAWDVGERALP